MTNSENSPFQQQKFTSIQDDVERNRIRVYWRHLSAVLGGCLCLFIFDMCERGVQLRNPFYSIWVTEVGTNLALAFIILAGICAGLYFCFLSYMIWKVKTLFLVRNERI